MLVNLEEARGALATQTGSYTTTLIAPGAESSGIGINNTMPGVGFCANDDRIMASDWLSQVPEELGVLVDGFVQTSFDTTPETRLSMGSLGRQLVSRGEVAIKNLGRGTSLVVAR